jgi:hypothetical protein
MHRPKVAVARWFLLRCTPSGRTRGVGPAKVKNGRTKHYTRACVQTPSNLEGDTEYIISDVVERATVLFFKLVRAASVGLAVAVSVLALTVAAIATAVEHTRPARGPARPLPATEPLRSRYASPPPEWWLEQDDADVPPSPPCLAARGAESSPRPALCLAQREPSPAVLCLAQREPSPAVLCHAQREPSPAVLCHAQREPSPAVLCHAQREPSPAVLCHAQRTPSPACRVLSGVQGPLLVAPSTLVCGYGVPVAVTMVPAANAAGAAGVPHQAATSSASAAPTRRRTRTTDAQRLMTRY